MKVIRKERREESKTGKSNIKVLFYVILISRESAAASRERKKCYIENLEAQLLVLTATVEQLKAENEQLRSITGSKTNIAATTLSPAFEPHYSSKLAVKRSAQKRKADKLLKSDGKSSSELIHSPTFDPAVVSSLQSKVCVYLLTAFRCCRFQFLYM